MERRDIIAGSGQTIVLGNDETYSFDGTLNTLTVKQQGLLVCKVIQHSLCRDLRGGNRSHKIGIMTRVKSRIRLLVSEDLASACLTL
jgi:hypothetical protein